MLVGLDFNRELCFAPPWNPYSVVFCEAFALLTSAAVLDYSRGDCCLPRQRHEARVVQADVGGFQADAAEAAADRRVGVR